MSLPKPDMWVIDLGHHQLLPVPDDAPLLVVNRDQAVTVELRLEQIDVNRWVFAQPMRWN